MNAEDLTAILEAWYPTVAANIRALWGEPELDEYLARIMVMDGDQHGFEPAAWSALAKLQVLHAQTFPPQATRLDPWAAQVAA